MKKHDQSPVIKGSAKLAQDIFYAIPRIAACLLITPIYVVQGIYAKYYGLALTTIAGVILFVRLFDAITDPIIGYLSDNYRLKRGTRKPYMILGAIVLISGGYFLYSPPDSVGALYFTFWFIVFFLGFTLFEIPHLAWGGEISHVAHEKTQTFALRTVAGYIGLILFYSIPLLPIWDTTEITPATLEFAAIVSGLMMLPLLYFCMTQVPDGNCFSEQGSIVKKKGSSDKALSAQLLNTLKSVIDNKPLLLFFGAFLFGGSGLGMWLGLIFIYVDAYLGMGVLFSEIYLISLVLSLPGSLVLFGIARYLGKNRAWLLVMVLAIAGFSLNGVLDPENASYWKLLILISCTTLCFVCTEFLAKSMLSDIVDFSAWKFKTYRGSTYFSLYVFIYKATLAIGGALGLAIAGWYGFDPSTTTQTSSGITGLKLSMTWMPILLVGISMIFIALSPITAHRHGIIRRRLDAIASRSKIESGKPQGHNKGTIDALITTRQARSEIPHTVDREDTGINPIKL